jgi:hypothetical protein
LTIVVASQTHVPPNFAVRLGTLLGIPLGNQAWLELAAAMTEAEGSTAEWNPWDTTYALEGATDFNTDGVKNYPHPVVGICATALTLILPAYEGILGDLQSGKYTAVEIVNRNAAEFDTWGTGAKLLLEVLERSAT